MSDNKNLELLYEFNDDEDNDDLLLNETNNVVTQDNNINFDIMSLLPSSNHKKIKKIFIDDILESKHILNGDKWVLTCKFNNCNIPISKSDNVCKEHLNILNTKLNKNTIIVRNDIKYKWNGKKFKQLCMVILCDLESTSTGKCKKHLHLNISSDEDMFKNISTLDIIQNYKL